MILTWRTKNINMVWIGVVLLIGFGVFMTFPALAEASPNPQQDAEPCALCHWSETNAWEHSPHAQNDVNCEHCHGSYIEDHPSAGLMQLSVDSRQCIECHETTYDQWQHSLHAKADVNCINCHVSHSQTTRLQAAQLCCTCHTSEFNGSCGVTAHETAGVTCVDCHVSQPHGTAQAQYKTPSHTFTAVPSQLCMDCHSSDMHDPAAVGTVAMPQTSVDTESSLQLASLSAQTSDLSGRLDTAEKQNRSLQVVAVALLGLGLGIGIFMGIIVMLIFGYISQKQETVL